MTKGGKDTDGREDDDRQCLIRMPSDEHDQPCTQALTMQYHDFCKLLRPILVGKDTEMHELMIFFGTLGGIVMFGVIGIIIGPIVAALFR